MATASLAGLMTLEQARAQGVTPKTGGTLTSLLTPEPAILIPGVNSQAPSLLVQSKMYQSLLEFSPTLEPKPLLAKSWTLSDDKKTWTFHLQENVKFHDGQPMTADDVIFSIMKFHFALAPARPWRVQQHRHRDRARPAHRRADAEGAVRAVPADVRRDGHRDHAEAHLRPARRGRRGLPQQPGQPEAGRHRAVRVRGVAARQLHPAEEVRRLLEAGPAVSGRASPTASSRTARAARSRCRPGRC